MIKHTFCHRDICSGYEVHAAGDYGQTAQVLTVVCPADYEVGSRSRHTLSRDAAKLLALAMTIGMGRAYEILAAQVDA